MNGKKDSRTSLLYYGQSTCYLIRSVYFSFKKKKVSKQTDGQQMDLQTESVKEMRGRILKTARFPFTTHETHTSVDLEPKIIFSLSKTIHFIYFQFPSPI